MKYYVDFYDAFDGWGIVGFYTDRVFEDLEQAKQKATELQAGLSKGNINMGEHYAVIDVATDKEVFCLSGQTIESQNKQEEK